MTEEARSHLHTETNEDEHVNMPSQFKDEEQKGNYKKSKTQAQAQTPRSPDDKKKAKNKKRNAKKNEKKKSAKKAESGVDMGELGDFIKGEVEGQ